MFSRPVMPCVWGCLCPAGEPGGMYPGVCFVEVASPVVRSVGQGSCFVWGLPKQPKKHW